jgi:hypothetical protein
VWPIASRSINEALTTGNLLLLTNHGGWRVGRWLVDSVAEKLMRPTVTPRALEPIADVSQVADCQRRAAATT